MRRPRSVTLGDGSDQLSLMHVEPNPGRLRRAKHVHVHTPEELAAFGRSIANSMRIRGDALSKSEGAAAFLLRHSGERVFYVAPWLSRLSGVTMTIARLSRRVWAARTGLCPMPAMTPEQEALVRLLLDPVVTAPNAP